MPTNLICTRTARARSSLYRLLSQLIFHGATEEQILILRQIDELATVLPDPLELDQLKVVHEALFGLNVFPYESLYLDGSGMVGGTVTRAVLSHYQQVGYQASASTPSADHLGEELSLLAFLCEAEADAREDQLDLQIRRLETEQRGFLEEHLLRWFFPCVQTIYFESSSFFGSVAEIIQDLVLTHYTDLINSSTAVWIQIAE